MESSVNAFATGLANGEYDDDDGFWSDERWDFVGANEDFEDGIAGGGGRYDSRRLHGAGAGGNAEHSIG